MIKSVIRQPILLTKLKRKDKFAQRSHLQGESKQNIEYDLQVHQEPLAANNLSVKEGRNQGDKTHQSYSNFSYLSQSQGILAQSNRPNQFSQTNMESALSFRKEEHINKTTANLRFSENAHLNKQNAILYQPQLVNLKARAINTINNSKAYALKETKPINHLEVITQISQQCKSQYERRVQQLQHLNQQANQKIKNLQNRLKTKEQMAIRVQKIQKDLAVLYQQNQELQRMNQSLSKPEHSCNQVEIQTQLFPIFVQDAFCQTQAFEPKMMEFSQLQRQKMAYLNREKEYKITIDNMKIESRQAMDRLRDEMQSLLMKYQGKCQEVKDKESLINRYLVNK